ncbi:fumarylacetoacetate hydrolase family protein [Gryllotalpicola protaetiae]|uniref:fumarylacetoacetate hydrolase family protein n=1 Tax=Gryllotalpicola protaetiae TaxID=2419771 RepID=UPI0013C49296|nr:fumarylacetoacetate hydrolase family protein [Gryllotalpicola protaetiae]
MREAFAALVAERGDTAIGWKIGMASASGMATAGIDAPLVGCLLADARLESGATIDVSDWVGPKLEPEIAVWLGADVPAGASPEQASAAVSHISLAFELVDLPGPVDDAVAALDINVFQHGVIFGERVLRSTPPPVTVLVNGETHAEVAEPTTATAPYGELVQHVAAVLGSAGRTLRAGEVIITGMLTPPIPLVPGTYAMRADGLGEIAFTVA